MPSLSRLHQKCKRCPNVNNCDNKRLEACALMKLPKEIGVTMPNTNSMLEPIARPYTPVTIHMGEYGDINTLVEEIKENIAEEINKPFKINCTLTKHY